MRSPEDLKSHLWKHLGSDRTIMLGLAAASDDHPRPMTALIDREHGQEQGPLWIFTATDTSIARALSQPEQAVATFVSKNEDLYATLRGTLTRDMNRAVIERLWNPFVAAWYEGGKDDPKLCLLRFDLASADIWENASSLMTGIRALFGEKVRESYEDRHARVAMR